MITKLRRCETTAVSTDSKKLSTYSCHAGAARARNTRLTACEIVPDDCGIRDAMRAAW